jgi:hypothetical protein
MALKLVLYDKSDDHWRFSRPSDRTFSCTDFYLILPVNYIDKIKSIIIFGYEVKLSFLYILHELYEEKVVYYTDGEIDCNDYMICIPLMYNFFNYGYEIFDISVCTNIALRLENYINDVPAMYYTKNKNNNSVTVHSVKGNKENLPNIYLRPKNITNYNTKEQIIKEMCERKSNICLTCYSCLQSTKLSHILLPEFSFGKLLFLKFNKINISNVKSLKMKYINDINQYIFNMDNILKLPNENALCIHFTNAFNVDISNKIELINILNVEKNSSTNMDNNMDIYATNTKLKILDHNVVNNKTVYLEVITYDDTNVDDIDVIVAGQNIYRQMFACSSSVCSGCVFTDDIFLQNTKYF